MKTQDRAQKARKFRLDVVGAIEDQPRMIRAYGRACMGEFGLVLRPREGRGVLVQVTKDGAGSWEAGATGDAPGVPTSPIEAKDAVARVRGEQKGIPAPGPTTLRGRWSGYLHCDDGKPRVELKRPLAAYGTLWVESAAEVGWTWRFQRGERWFADAGDLAGDRYPTLARAIEAGVLGAMKLVSEACSFRDTRRRAAHDPAFAERYPIQASKEGKDPTERLKEPVAKKARKKAEAKASAPEPAGAKVEEKPKPPRRPRAAKKAPVAAPVAEGVDPEKNQQLIDAFSKAVAAAMGGEAP